jgi:predicted outer membrane repeat protein
VFENNSAIFSGGGLYANGSSGMSSPSLQAVTFIGNHAGQYGGGMYSNGVDGVSSPVLTDVVFTGNTAGYAGGAVVFTGNAAAGASMPRIMSTVFENNFAVHQGGAVDSQGTSATFQDVAFIGNGTVPPTTAPNEGGAVLFTDGDAARNVQFTSARFFGNHSCTGGGVVVVLTHATSVARFDRATFAGNSSSDANCQGSAGGIDVVGGNTEIRDSLFVNNVAAYFGGAMISNNVLTVDHSAFVGNSAQLSGGAVSLGGASAQITNSTFSNNTSYSQSTPTSKGGGAIAAGAGTVLALRNVTMAANHAFNGPGGALSIDVANGSLDTTPVSATISDSILWSDTATTENEIHTDPSSSTTIDHSIIQNGCPSGSTCSTVSSADPLLGLFQMYGGYTPALMPAANSPAINSGVSCTADDQRGVARPQGPGCDIGALERRSVEDYLFNNGFDL